MEQLTESEFKEMLGLLTRYASTNLDQFEHWKLDSQIGKVYLEISLAPSGPEKAYTDLSHLL